MVVSSGGRGSEEMRVRGVVIGRTSEKEGTSDPEAGKACARCNVCNGSLYFPLPHTWPSKENLEVGPVAVFGRIVGKHQVGANENK